MKQLILIRGISGSGKTTLANTICGKEENRCMISVDDFFTNEETGEHHFNPENLKEAHEWCKTECSEAMQDEYEVIVIHNTFTRKWEADPYLSMAKREGYQVHVINLYDGGLSDQELAQRSGHKTPAHIIQKQRKRWDKDVYRERRYPQQNTNYRGGYDNRYNQYNQRPNRGYDDYRGPYYKKDPKW